MSCAPLAALRVIAGRLLHTLLQQLRSWPISQRVDEQSPHVELADLLASGLDHASPSIWRCQPKEKPCTSTQLAAYHIILVRNSR